MAAAPRAEPGTGKPGTAQQLTYSGASWATRGAAASTAAVNGVYAPLDRRGMTSSCADEAAKRPDRLLGQQANT